jgi:hypothetical protein
MAADIEPSELVLLVDFAERARVDDWSLRSAAVRYAQPEPERVSRILECVRRTDGALHSHARLLQKSGPEVWSAFASDGEESDADTAEVVGLLGVAAELDRLGDLLASWADDWPAERPNDEVDVILEDVEARLDRLGVAPEEPPPMRGGDGVPARRRG